MNWPTAYLSCFLLGLTFVALSALTGQFGGDAHGGHAPGGHSADGSGHEASFPLLSPLVLALFVGMFGVGGLLLIKGLGLTSPLLHVPGAAATSLTSGFGVAWLMMKVMRHAESNSLARQQDVLGRQVEVTLSIRGQEPGEIAYVAGGTRHTMPALAESQAHHVQGEQVRVLEVVKGVARVGPAPLEAPALPLGTPVSPPRNRKRR